MTDKRPQGFVSLSAVRDGRPDPKAAIAQIREIYFRTTKRTIDHDLAHAVELLKGLSTEEERQKATVYMHGLAEMRKEWGIEREDEGARRTRDGGATQTRRKRAPGGRK